MPVRANRGKPTVYRIDGLYREMFNEASADAERPGTYICAHHSPRFAMANT
jgi:hypothetical protein